MSASERNNSLLAVLSKEYDEHMYAKMVIMY